MDNYFDNVNTNVTVRKYGSTFNKKIVPDKDLIPITERPNRTAEAQQALTESIARFSDNLSKVNTRQLNEIKEQRLAEKVMTEGYATLKDDLLKDIMRQVCVESLLVDEDVVLENINILHEMVDSEVDAMGAYNGLKAAFTKTGNPLLESMIETIDEMAKAVGDRVLQEGKCQKEMSFKMNPEEVQDFDYKKKDLGVEEISDFVKDRVLKVVQDEQAKSKEKGEVMDEIETKLKDAETDVAVSEAMNDIFDTKGLDQVTLFESMMRIGYKNLLETSSSAIFESSSFDDDDDIDDDDYSMSDIELDDDDDEESLVDIEDKVEEDLVEKEGLDPQVAKIFNNNAPAVMEALNSEDYEGLEEALDKMADDLESVEEGCKSRSKCTKVKESIRKVQKCTAEVIDEACKNGREACKEELLICPDCGEDPCVCDDEEDLMLEARMEMEDLESIIQYDYKSMKDNTKRVKKFTLKLIKGCKKTSDINILNNLVVKHKKYLAEKAKEDEKFKKDEEDFKTWANTEYKDAIDKRMFKLKESVDLEEGLATRMMSDNKIDAKLKKEENTLNRITSNPYYDPKDPRTRMVVGGIQDRISELKKEQDRRSKKVVKEESEIKDKDSSDDSELTEGFNIKEKLNKIKTHISVLNRLSEDGAIEQTKVNLTNLINRSTSSKELDAILREFVPMEKYMKAAKFSFPEKSREVKEFLKWLNNDAKKLIADRRKELKSQAVKESFSIKDKMNKFLDRKIADRIAKGDLNKNKTNLVELINDCKSSEELDYIFGEFNVEEKHMNDAKLRYPDKAEKIDDYVNWLKKDCKKLIANRRKELKAQSVKESFDLRIDNLCESLNAEIDKHLDALNLALESVNVVYDGTEICAPMLGVKDCNLSNIQMAYKTKVVCESLKHLFEQVDNIEETRQLEEMVNLNLGYIAEAMNSIEGKANAEYKTKMLRLAENYLGKLNRNAEMLNESFLLESAVEPDYTEAINQVRNVYETIKNSELMEGTNNEFMEVVLAEAIVKYTIMEAFSTLHLKTYTSDEIRKMSRANIK